MSRPMAINPVQLNSTNVASDPSEGGRTGVETRLERQNRQVQLGLSGVTAAGEFKQRSVRGTAAALLGQGLSMGLQLGSTIILARLLSPSDFGLQGMVLT